MPSLQLPQPSSEALAASRALTAQIQAEIHDAGAISFARYMELALYTPNLGYYSGGAAKLGASGDFTTAPEMTPLFGACLAQVALDIMPESAQSRLNLLEFGAGSGQLAHALLSELAHLNQPAPDYSILELSAELAERQQQRLRDFQQVQWLNALPQPFHGVMIANEVLDAMPVELVVKRGEHWQQRMVALGSSDAQPFVLTERRCDDALLDHIQAEIPNAADLPDGYQTELHPLAIQFTRTIAGELAKSGGAAMLIDYGFPAAEYFLPQRNRGTLMCHYRHHAHGDPFFLPGLQDITAHVNFSAVAAAAAAAGCEVLCYTSQAGFLLSANVLQILQRSDPSDAQTYLPQANMLQKLLSPAEMGELFKVMVIGKNLSLPQQYQRYDRSSALTGTDTPP